MFLRHYMINDSQLNSQLILTTHPHFLLFLKASLRPFCGNSIPSLTVRILSSLQPSQTELINYFSCVSVLAGVNEMRATRDEKYLLSASYICTHNPNYRPAESPTKKRRVRKPTSASAIAAANAATNRPGTDSTHMPKPFDLKKLLELYGQLMLVDVNIESEEVEQFYTARLLPQLANLVSLGLVKVVDNTPSQNELHTLRFCANVDKLFITAVAQSIDFPIDKYLC